LRRDVHGQERKPTDARMILALVADLLIHVFVRDICGI